MNGNNRYDNFNPSIPETNETSETVNSTQHEHIVSKGDETHVKDTKTKNKSIKKKQPADSIPDKKGFFRSIAEWATSQTVRWIIGLILIFLGIYIGVALLSYIDNSFVDQSEISNTTIGTSRHIKNAAGEAGARLSETIVNEGFGAASAVIVLWLLLIGFKLLTSWPKFKTLNFTIKVLLALITVSLALGCITSSTHETVMLEGFHGRYVNEFIRSFLGDSGAWLITALFGSILIVICLRDVFNALISRYHLLKERRRIAKLKEAERMAKLKEEEEMRRFEEEAKKRLEKSQVDDEIEEDEIPTPQDHVSFSDDNLGLYESLSEDELNVSPDIDSGLNPSDSDDNSQWDSKDIDTDEDVNLSDDANAKDDVDSYSINEDTDLSENIIDSDDEYEIEDDEESSSPANVNDTSVGSQADVLDSEEYNKEDAINAPNADSEKDLAVHKSDSMIVNVNQIAQTEQTKVSDAPLSSMHPYKFPPVDLLREGNGTPTVNEDELLEKKEQIQKTLSDFGIPIVSIEATVGPTVTLYEIVPDRGVKINKIRNLGDDIQLSLAAVGVRIIAPIPGKGTVGIEVANEKPQTVSMRTVILSKSYQESKFHLPVAVGSKISNEIYITDLAKMPHLLVAGATGQGKSVGLNAIITSLLYSKTPDELKFVMVDPKMVEFSLYSKIEAHYLAKIPDSEDSIITDMDKVVATLSSLCVEMDNRYQLLKLANVRNIEEYNKKIKDRVLNPIEGHRFLPYIVVVVDEFSDLIMTAGKEVEIPIARLAQKARAVGMHVIIATQRPSTNVITGIIKANFPARMAFKVSSGVDSKTILDTTGAQQLIGRGDMLISNNAPMVRVQCAFIDTPEVEAICDYIHRQPYGQGAYILPDPVVTKAGDSEGEIGNNFGDKDPLFDEIARLIVSSNTASTSSLQRRYSIGYNRAGKIMDQLEAAGIVGPSQGGKPRSVLVDSITLESILNT